MATIHHPFVVKHAGDTALKSFFLITKPRENDGILTNKKMSLMRFFTTKTNTIWIWATTLPGERS
jgi:hypothetical protein